MNNGNQSAYPFQPWKEILEDLKSGFPAIGGVNPIGLTKREYFAGLAMQGLLAAGNGVTGENGDESTKSTDIARGSVAYADALLAELEKKPTH